MMTRILPAAAIVAAGALAAAGSGPSASTATGSGFQISRAKTDARIQASASGADLVQLALLAELVTRGGLDVTDDMVVTWQEVGGVEPEPFRVLIPAGCFMNRRGHGFFVEDFRTCGVELSISSAPRGLLLLEIVDFRARLVRSDDRTWRFNIVASFVPPDPVIPPDPIVPITPARAFLGLVGGAALQFAIGTESAAAPPLRMETVSGVEPQPF
jgi:hypothetical protein